MDYWIARNIVNQLGDLYMETTKPRTPERTAFVLYRQATNDLATDFVSDLLTRSINEEQVLKVLENHETSDPDRLAKDIIRALLGQLR